MIAWNPTVEADFPPGTPVRVRLTMRRRGSPIQAEIVGVVDAWQSLPTGSWYAHGHNDLLWLKRLRLKKLDGEVTLLVLDDSSSIARLQPATED